MRPKMFVGSSREGKYVAEGLVANLDDAECSLWPTIFALSVNTVDALIKQTSSTDFAVLVFSPDDTLTLRCDEFAVARDNVIYECGLFTGGHGKDRTFIVKPTGVDKFHIPTDLLGVTVAMYDPARAAKDAHGAMTAAAIEIKKAIKLSDWSKLDLDISVHVPDKIPGLTFERKLWFTVKNQHRYPVCFESLGFELDPSLRLAARFTTKSSGPYPLALFHHKQSDSIGGTKDITVERTVLEPSATTSAWLPIDPAIGEVELRKAIAAKKCGVWKYRCCWLQDRVVTCSYERDF